MGFFKILFSFYFSFYLFLLVTAKQLITNFSFFPRFHFVLRSPHCFGKFRFCFILYFFFFCLKFCLKIYLCVCLLFCVCSGFVFCFTFCFLFFVRQFVLVNFWFHKKYTSFFTGFLIFCGGGGGSSDWKLNLISRRGYGKNRLFSCSRRTALHISLSVRL